MLIHCSVGEFNVDDIVDIEWDEAPYNNLVLPEGERELVMAFADRPRLSTQGFDDFIAHKGDNSVTWYVKLYFFG